MPATEVLVFVQFVQADIYRKACQQIDLNLVVAVFGRVVEQFLAESLLAAAQFLCNEGCASSEGLES